jgi:hypothetical protein
LFRDRVFERHQSSIAITAIDTHILCAIAEQQGRQMNSVDPERRRLLTTVGVGAVGIAGLTAGLVAASSVASSSGRSALSAFEGSRAWIGSEPLGAAALTGKVVLVNFWTLVHQLIAPAAVLADLGAKI